MRKEPYGVGSMVHVMKRGARGLPLTRDLSDQLRFTRLLYYLNDTYRDEFWESHTAKLQPFTRPSNWPRRDPIVHIYAWVLMPNHFHFVLKEIQDGGISSFMQRLCTSMSMHFNIKYAEKGSLFQGPYKSKTIETDEYLKYLLPYIMVKNVFELYPGGLLNAKEKFDHA